MTYLKGNINSLPLQVRQEILVVLEGFIVVLSFMIWNFISKQEKYNGRSSAMPCLAWLHQQLKDIGLGWRIVGGHVNFFYPFCVLEFIRPCLIKYSFIFVRMHTNRIFWVALQIISGMSPVSNYANQKSITLVTGQSKGNE